jgi:hypothetical protein
VSDDLIDPGPIRDQINHKISQLFDANHRVVTVLRMQATDFETIGTYLLDQANKAFEIANLIAQLSIIASHNTSNMILAQFGHDEEAGLLDLSSNEEDYEG